MPSNLSDRRVSPLRTRMIEDMTVRGFTEKTRQDYVRHVQAFAAFIGRSPATATPEDMRGFQLHQRQSSMQPPSINTAVSALRFLFTVTLDRPDLARRHHGGAPTAPTAVGPERRRGHSIASDSAGTEVQSRIRHRIRRRPACL